MQPADWAPSRFQRAWWTVLGTVAPRRVMLSRHFDRYDKDPVYKAEWNTMLKREYQNARSSDTDTPFRSNLPRSADADLLGSLPRMRAKARELVRDDAVAKGCIRAWTEGVAGTGIQDKAKTGEAEKNAVINAVWKRLRANLFPAELMSWEKSHRMMAKSSLVDAEIVVTRFWPASGGAVEFAIVEADRLATPTDSMPEDPEGWIRDGVERDRTGRIVAYWLADNHPADTGIEAIIRGKLVNTQPLVKANFRRVVVSDAHHLKHGTPRPGQSRGEPVFHAIIQDLRDLDLLVIAVLKRVQVSAMFAAFIETREDLQTIASATAKKHGFRLDQDLIPGMIFKLFPGEKIETLNPNFPMVDLDVFVRLLARRIGTALGISWQIVLSDFSEANFSSAKADDRRAEQSYATVRQDLVECLAWIRSTALQDALMLSDEELLEAGVTAADIDKVVWIPPTKRVLLDSEKENKADIMAVAAGFLSSERVLAARSIDSREELRQILLEEKLEIEMRKELGLGPPVEQAIVPGLPTPAAQPAEDGAEDESVSSEDPDDDTDENDDTVSRGVRSSRRRRRRRLTSSLGAQLTKTTRTEEATA